MKKRASFLKALFVILAILVAGLYISGYGYLIELGAKIIELGRTSAGLEDYVYFDSREIPKSDDPQAWPLHADYNSVPATTKLQKLHQDHKTVAFLVIKNDSIWHEQYFEGFGKDSKTNSFSMVKTMFPTANFKKFTNLHLRALSI